MIPGNSGNKNDPVWLAYEATPEEQQEAFRALFTVGNTDAQIAAALEYLTGAELDPLDIRRFRSKLATGRVTW